WPEGMGMASVHDLEIAYDYAKTVAKEYRALGITTALGPQIDLGSDPRWFRIQDTFGSDVKLTTELARTVCDGLQTTEGAADGWGRDSVIAMVKHWPGGGTGEGGRDAHYPFGKYAVYPGNNFETHLKPFVEGAFQLKGKTESCAAIMPYYSVPWNQDKKYHENVGNSYSKYIIQDLLIKKYGYEGVICTDWGITKDKTPRVEMYVMGGKCHGVEELTQAERILKLIDNGVNQFGGLDERGVVDAAYKLGCEKYGQDYMDGKLCLSAYKLLLNLFRLGLFDQPYLDVEESKQVVGCKEHVEHGLAAQRKSPVLLKNKNQSFPLPPKVRVYIPMRHIEPYYGFVRMKTQAEERNPVGDELTNEYFVRVESPEKADAAIVFVDSPRGRNGYEFDMMKGNNQKDPGYYPISLQYRPYTAELAREHSIAGGDPRENDYNRSYKGRMEVTANEFDLDLIIQTKRVMQEKPVIVVLRMERPTVIAEWEHYADAILVDFGVKKDVLFELLSGEVKPSGKLPVLIPKNMENVESHCEDVVDDIEAYIDETGHIYSIGFGL
ncbi:MAG: glycoside hydrolase family 3 N-terminal domain-containing protein, partial [Oliverpabstia sp.]